LIRGRQTVFETPWFQVEAKQTDLDEQPFYSLKVPDYVAVIAWTPDDRIVLVRQYRPAIEQETLELPSGLVDSGEQPEVCAARELEEETGYRATSLKHLGTLFSDTGRLQNRIWCYLAKDITRLPAWNAEKGIAVELLRRESLSHAITDGRFSHALHVAALALDPGFDDLRRGLG
jgi:ADP-ribose pyrophosphatase